LIALASRQVEAKARSGFFPQVSASAVAVGTAEHNTRLSALGALNNPGIFQRNAEGLMISQLITDFGRTANLVQSAKFAARAEENQAEATREQILLAVDAAFFSALQAQALIRVAEKTLSSRQILLEQVSALASNKLRSELDVSFAAVNVEDARLLLSKARNDLDAAFAELSDLMGARQAGSYRLVEEPEPVPLATNATDYTQQALRSRPDLQRLRNEQAAAFKLARAERAARYPQVAAVGAAGVAPIHDPELRDDYAAAGITVTVPVFAGGLLTARERDAELRADAAGQGLRELENDVIRDVRIAWLNAQNAFERLRITAQILQNARRAFDLAEARYRNGISSMVELNQAELNQVSAEISFANTRYEYFLQRSKLSYQTGSLR
jgi:outer membrane protein